MILFLNLQAFKSCMLSFSQILSSPGYLSGHPFINKAGSEQEQTGVCHKETYNFSMEEAIIQTDVKLQL